MVPSAPMPVAVAVIIPALNEEDQVAAAVESARAAGASAVLVVDGGSSDRTVANATRAGGRVIISRRACRAAQLNDGARAAAAAGSDILLFLHADSELPHDAVAAINDALRAGHDCGGFRLRFKEKLLKLRIAEALINFRTRITRAPWGDQAQFITVDAFAGLGGFREMPLMEDYDFAIRARRELRPIVIDRYVRTSARRFVSKGVLQTAITNWRIIAGYHAGEDPSRLAALYRGEKVSRARRAAAPSPASSSDAHGQASD